jgi:uncharacterized membrane protein
MTTLLFANVIATALVAGVLFAFSTSVMRALARLEPVRGIAAMQSINIVILNPVFFAAFLGAGLLSLVTIGIVLFDGPGDSRVFAIAGGALYLIGCIGVTGTRNVPLNDRLEAMDAEDPATAEFWRVYVDRWTRWNHVRVVASLAASAAFALAIAAG